MAYIAIDFPDKNSQDRSIDVLAKPVEILKKLQKGIPILIDNFNKVVHLGPKESNLEMDQPTIPTKHDCNTIACHAGWYAISKNLKRTYKRTHYEDGIEDIAQDLKIDTRTLLSFMSNNPSIWGNAFGGGMFTMDRAFRTTTSNGAETLQDIIDFWQAVHKRVDNALSKIKQKETKQERNKL